MSDTWEDAGTRKELEVTGEEPTIGEKEAGRRQIVGLRRMSGATGSGVFLFWIGSLTTCENGRRDRLESGRRVRKAAAQRGDSSGLDQTEVDTCD